MGIVDFLLCILMFVTIVYLAYSMGRWDGDAKGYERGYKSGLLNGRLQAAMDLANLCTCLKRRTR
jgi:hypothetical protein